MMRTELSSTIQPRRIVPRSQCPKLVGFTQLPRHQFRRSIFDAMSSSATAVVIHMGKIHMDKTKHRFQLQYRRVLTSRKNMEKYQVPSEIMNKSLMHACTSVPTPATGAPGAYTHIRS